MYPITQLNIYLLLKHVRVIQHEKQNKSGCKWSLMEIEKSQTAFIVVETGQTILDQPRFTYNATD